MGTFQMPSIGSRLSVCLVKYSLNKSSLVSFWASRRQRAKRSSIPKLNFMVTKIHFCSFNNRLLHFPCLIMFYSLGMGRSTRILFFCLPLPRRSEYKSGSTGQQLRGLFYRRCLRSDDNPCVPLKRRLPGYCFCKIIVVARKVESVWVARFIVL